MKASGKYFLTVRIQKAMVQWEAKAVHQTWQQNLPIIFEGLPLDTGFESNSGMKGSWREAEA